VVGCLTSFYSTNHRVAREGDRKRRPCYNAIGDPMGTTTHTLTIEVLLPSVKLIVVTEPDE